jgi:acyl-CoA thioester hydrolase
MNATFRVLSTMPTTSIIWSIRGTSTGVSFAALHEQGVDPVVARINMAFKTPLKSGDEFVSKLAMKKEGIKYVFYQDIFRASDNKVAIKAVVETVCVVNGRLSDSELFDNVFAPYLDHE